MFMATEPEKIPGKNATYDKIQSALYILAQNQHSPPSLAQLANDCGLSEFHFQKMFKRWVGISPKRFSQYLSKEYIKTLLDEGIKPLDASYQAGLSGPARLHDLFIQTEAVSRPNTGPKVRDCASIMGFMNPLLAIICWQ